ncbi:histidine kinase [Methylobacterium sp. E-045]|uniref:histidine kinase n=1 Tax=Methylobacterium sp. E-045 TaxID=2836575 RepID=UPI001FB8E03F|nr:histidine kinase [Methylobacterium sp. E-045]MCJ2129605.1 histidine kinase [Methylobacterium sp. E-045]
MADYYPLLARALQAMPDRSPALRKAVYDRARGALIGQLRSLEPPLSEADIDLESKALETAISKVESEHGGPPAAVANDVAPPDFAVPEERDTLPEAEAPDRSADTARGRVAEPALPPALEPNLGIRPSRPDRQPGAPTEASAPEPLPPTQDGPAPVSREAAPVLPIKPRKAKSADKVADRKAAREAARKASSGEAASDAPEPEPAAEPMPEPPVAERETMPAAGDGANARHRPRIDVVAPRKGRPRLIRNVFVGSVLLIVVGLIAVAAFMLRDKPSDLQPGNTEAQGEATESGASKYADRIGGEAPASSERRDSSSRQTPAATPADPTKPPAQPDVAVAQRAVLFEENTAGGNAQPITFQGMVVWRLEAMNGEQGQPLETVIRGRLTFAEAGLSLVMTIRRNLDPTFPASHTIELAFTTTSPAGDTHSVQDVGLLSAKDEEAGRGSPVSGLPVRVKENLFLIGLSSLQADVDRNTDLLEHRNWFDLPIKFASGPRGVLTFEKGSSGNQVIRSAFEQWRR